MRRHRAVVGAVGIVLARTTAKLGKGHHQRALPRAQLGQRAFEGRHALGQLLHQIGVRTQLVLVGVKTAQRERDHRHAALARLRCHHLRRSLHAIAKSARRKLRVEAVFFPAQALRGLVHVVFNPQQILKRRVSLGL